MSRAHEQPQTQPRGLVRDARVLEFPPRRLGDVDASAQLGNLMSRVIDGIATAFERQLVASAAAGREGIGLESACACGAPLSAHFTRQETVAGRGRWLGCEHAAQVTSGRASDPRDICGEKSREGETLR